MTKKKLAQKLRKSCTISGLCPKCKKEVSKEKNPYFPFCSKRCQDADLYKWLTEEYSIKREITSDDLDNPDLENDPFVDKIEK